MQFLLQWMVDIVPGDHGHHAARLVALESNLDLEVAIIHHRPVAENHALSAQAKNFLAKKKSV